MKIVAHNDKWCATKSYSEDKINVSKYNGETCNTDSTSELVENNKIWDGWITLNLYYPTNSTNRQWRLGSEGEVRSDDTLMWQPYTGAITVLLERVEDIWIRYTLEDEDVVIPPAGKLLVDIQPDSYEKSKLVSSVKVKIEYDEKAETKEYKIGSSDWMPYKGEFTVTENTIIEARTSKKDYIYDDNGNIITERNVVGRDSVYIGNIGVETKQLPAPYITRLSPTNEKEVAKVKITYPEGDYNAVYKINYGIEEKYNNIITKLGDYKKIYDNGIYKNKN